MNSTALIIATKTEARPFLMREGIVRIEKKPFLIFMDKSLIIIISGIGPIKAAAATAYLLARYSPRRICNLGAAGASVDSAGVGDIFQVKKAVPLDRKGLLPGARPHINLPIIKGLHASACTLATADRPVTSPDERQKAGRYADIIDMEGYAVARTCALFETKLFINKIVTDTGNDAVPVIIKNIRATRMALYDFFIRDILPVIIKE